MKSLFLFLILSASALAQEYTFKHIDCNIRLNKNNELLNKLAHQKLKEKSYRPKDYVDGNKMNEGDLYFELEMMRDPKKLWKDCIVKVAIKKAKKQKASSKDRTLFGRSIKRSLPRHTFDGNERCKRGLKDAFVHIPYCRTMTINEKVQGN